MKHATIGTNGEAIATDTEQSQRVSITKILLLVNDDTTNKLYINFNADTSTSNCICLAPNESFKNLDYPVDTVYFKSSSSSTNFRFIGVNENK